MRDGAAEDLALVDQVRQPVRMRLGAELAAGALPFLDEELVDARPQGVQELVPHEAAQNHVADFVELSFMLFVHGVSRLGVRPSNA